MSGHRRVFVLASVVALAGTATACTTAAVLATLPPMAVPTHEPPSDGCTADADRAGAEALGRLPLITNYPDEADLTADGVGCDADDASAHRAYLLPADTHLHPRVIAFYQALAMRDGWQPSGDGKDFTTQAAGDYLCVTKDIAGQAARVILSFNDGSQEGGSAGYTVDASFSAPAGQFRC